MTDSIPKQQKAFYRKLYISFLISKEHHCIASLHKLTGMPRRTLQDCIRDLSDIGIHCTFTQQEGGKHNSGYYVLNNWGPIEPLWIKENILNIEKALTI